MKFTTKEKRFWKTKFFFHDLKNSPEQLQQFNLRDDYFTDAHLGFITNRIRSIERLDLDNNLIDDEWISGLKKLRILKSSG